MSREREGGMFTWFVLMNLKMHAVLSDPNKRILYDVGAYDSDADDEVC